MRSLRLFHSSTPPSRIASLAERALPLMTPERRAETERLLRELRTLNEERTDFQREAVAAFEVDLHPVSMALAGALHVGGLTALSALAASLPDLLDRVNAAPTFAEVLESGLISQFSKGYSEIAAKSTANAARSNERPEGALDFHRAKEILPTDLGSAELRQLSREIRERSLFSARTLNADYLEEIKTTIDRMLSGEIGQSAGRIKLMERLKELGYDPATGFPEELAALPPAERNSLQDLSSARRIDLVLETNQRMAANYGRVIAGNSDYARYAYPAWELLRLYLREVPRGTPESHSVGWEKRWTDAGNEVGWIGALQGAMIALKDSPIWPALGNGAGGYEDTLGNPYPPFAFRSGYAWRAVPRAEALTLGLLGGSQRAPAPMIAQLSPAQEEVKAAFARLSPALQASLRRRFAA